jgi:hypothetical protein
MLAMCTPVGLITQISERFHVAEYDPPVFGLRGTYHTNKLERSIESGKEKKTP